jgi:hypothetical protein
MLDGDTVNINVSASNNNDDLIDQDDMLKETMRTDGLTTINEEDANAPQNEEKNEDGEAPDDMERADPPEGEGEEGGDGGGEENAENNE